VRSSRLAAALLAAVLGCGAAGALRAQEAAAERPSRETVEAELAKLRDDPRFGGVKQTKTWRFKTAEDEKKPKPRSPLPDWLTWLVEFFRWVTAIGRVFVWALGALLVALLLVGLRYWIRERDRALPQRAAALPSHVRDLDIRPESLPDRIPNLLLYATSATTGLMSRVRAVQRIETSGGHPGPPPTDEQEEAMEQRSVPYTALYVFHGDLPGEHATPPGEHPPQH